MPSILTRETPEPERLRAWQRTTEGFIQSFTETDGRPTLLAGYQAAHLRDPSKFRARTKARGVGFSFVCAAGSDQKQKPKSGGDDGGDAKGDAPQKLAKKGEKLKEEMDSLVEEIDEVLEENAEEFVKNYVQRGGQ